MVRPISIKHTPSINMTNETTHSFRSLLYIHCSNPLKNSVIIKNEKGIIQTSTFFKNSIHTAKVISMPISRGR